MVFWKLKSYAVSVTEEGKTHQIVVSRLQNSKSLSLLQRLFLQHKTYPMYGKLYFQSGVTVEKGCNLRMGSF